MSHPCTFYACCSVFFAFAINTYVCYCSFRTICYFLFYCFCPFLCPFYYTDYWLPCVTYFLAVVSIEVCWTFLNFNFFLTFFFHNFDRCVQLLPICRFDYGLHLVCVLLFVLLLPYQFFLCTTFHMNRVFHGVCISMQFIYCTPEYCCRFFYELKTFFN